MNMGGEPFLQTWSFILFALLLRRINYSTHIIGGGLFSESIDLLSSRFSAHNVEKFARALDGSGP